MKKGSNFMLRLASFLFVAVLASTVMLSGLLARYTTTGTGSDSARVIKFGNIEIKETLSATNGKLVICPGVNITKDVEVFFSGSEAKTYVFVKMDTSDDWESNDGIHFNINNLVSFSIDTDQWTYLNGSNYAYYKEVAPNTTVGSVNGNSHIGVDVIKGGTITVSDRLTMDGLDAMTSIVNKIKKTDVDLDFSAIVVQANGFDKVEDAWASIKNK